MLSLSQSSSSIATGVTSPYDNNNDKAVVRETGDEEAVFLNDIWSIYFHGSEDPDWTLSSYTRLIDISTIQDFWKVMCVIGEHVPENMFFVMRESIYPCWDDAQNMYGGCVSLKVAKVDALRMLEYLLIRALGEALAKPNFAWEMINGLSVSPKRYFCIIKIWLKENSINTVEGKGSITEVLDLPSWYTGEALFKSHLDCIKANSDKLMACNQVITAEDSHARGSEKKSMDDTSILQQSMAKLQCPVAILPQPKLDRDQHAYPSRDPSELHHHHHRHRSAEQYQRQQHPETYHRHTDRHAPHAQYFTAGTSSQHHQCHNNINGQTAGSGHAADRQKLPEHPGTSTTSPRIRKRSNGHPPFSISRESLVLHSRYSCLEEVD